MMKINSTIFFTIISFFYSILLYIAYYSKEKIKTPENRIYSKLIIINIISIVLELLCCIFAGIALEYLNLYIIINKIFLSSLVLWGSIFGIYVFLISSNLSDKKELKEYMKKVTIAFSILYITITILIAYLPIKFNIVDNYVKYSYGLAVNAVYIGIIILIISTIFCLIKSYKNIKSKKYLPIYAYLLLGTIASFVQKIFPELLLATSNDAFITMLMYFTIENPDMKLLDEMHKAKEISDNANEEKTMFLYNMTQEIRETTKNINSEADIILDSDSLEQDKDSARNIKGETSKFMNMTNDILDVSTIDSTSIKVYNNKYNIKNILKEVIGIYTPKVKKKELEFRTNIEHNIPELLYGDSIGLKKVLSLILDNSVKYTEKGYVELDVNTIIKNDICRLIITIEDSGVGIKSSSLEQIKLNDLNTSQAYKTITLMNGTMLISSNYGVGTKVKIILDQKIQLEESADLKKYQEIYDNKKILVIDDNEATYKIVEKLLKGSNIIVDYSLTGKDTLTKLKNKKKYDLILLDEELSQITGYELLKKMREIRNFKVPVILLSKDNNYEYNEEYKQAGFTDVLIKPLKKDNLHLKIEKYIK